MQASKGHLSITKDLKGHLSGNYAAKKLFSAEIRHDPTLRPNILIFDLGITIRRLTTATLKTYNTPFKFFSNCIEYNDILNNSLEPAYSFIM